MGNLAVIVADQSMTKIVCATSIEVLWIALALQNISASKARHFFEVACRAVARNKSMADGPGVRLRQGYGAPAFALHYVASEGWRRGELNPCPRRYPRKHLHVYPTINSEEPSHAPAHCRLPSVHKIDSRTGVVAPPIRQPAVHVCRRSRRPTANVTVN